MFVMIGPLQARLRRRHPLAQDFAADIGHDAALVAHHPDGERVGRLRLGGIHQTCHHRAQAQGQSHAVSFPSNDLLSNTCAAVRPFVSETVYLLHCSFMTAARQRP
jgi:hypothetical protein